MLIGIAAALLACISYGVSSVLQAYGARKSAAAARIREAEGQITASGAPTLRSTLAASMTLAFIIGTVLDVVGLAGTFTSSRLVPLFLSQTIISSNLIVTAVLGMRVLGITLRTRDWVAIGTVIASLFVLGLASGHTGTGDRDPIVHWSVLGAAVLLLAVGLALVGVLGSRAAVAAGLMSGVLFGVLAIAVRILEGLDPLRGGDLLADPALWAILIGGGGGFYLHTVALPARLCERSHRRPCRWRIRRSRNHRRRLAQRHSTTRVRLGRRTRFLHRDRGRGGGRYFRRRVRNGAGPRDRLTVDPPCVRA